MDNYNKAQPQKLQLSDLLEADVQPREVNNPTLDGEALLNEISLPELTLPEDISPLAAFICSGAMDHATGTVIDVNAGSYMH